MDFLKRQWFLLASTLLFLGCAAYYILGAWMVGSANGDKVTELQGRHEKLDHWAKSPDQLPKKDETKVYVRYTEDLKTELEKSRKLLKAPARWQREHLRTLAGMSLEDLETKTPALFASNYRDIVNNSLKSQDQGRPSGYAKTVFLMTSDSLSTSSYTGNPEKAQILLDTKRLLIQMELMNILNDADIHAVRLKRIAFEEGGGSGAPGGEGGGSVHLRKPLSGDPQRTTHPFRLTVDLDLKGLPKLLSLLGKSSYNIAVTGMELQKIKLDGERTDLSTKGLIGEDRQNEVVRVFLACEATEFLFGEKAS